MDDVTYIFAILFGLPALMLGGALALGGIIRLVYLGLKALRAWWRGWRFIRAVRSGRLGI